VVFIGRSAKSAKANLFFIIIFRNKMQKPQGYMTPLSAGLAGKNKSHLRVVGGRPEVLLASTLSPGRVLWQQRPSTLGVDNRYFSLLKKKGTLPALR
jgi:hypothetical protein